MTFEDVWNKIKAVKLTTILGFYGNFVLTVIGVGLTMFVLYFLFLLIVKIFASVPWPVTLFVLNTVFAYLCAMKFGWGKK